MAQCCLFLRKLCFIQICFKSAVKWYSYIFVVLKFKIGNQHYTGENSQCFCVHGIPSRTHLQAMLVKQKPLHISGRRLHMQMKHSTHSPRRQKAIKCQTRRHKKQTTLRQTFSNPFSLTKLKSHLGSAKPTDFCAKLPFWLAAIYNMLLCYYYLEKNTTGWWVLWVPIKVHRLCDISSSAFQFSIRFWISLRIPIRNVRHIFNDSQRH